LQKFLHIRPDDDNLRLKHSAYYCITNIQVHWCLFITTYNGFPI
jgi:hypothetical protein